MLVVLQRLDAKGSNAAAEQDTDLAAIDQGFDFIEESWKTRTVRQAGLSIMRFTTKEVSKPDSPLFKWSPKTVEKAFNRLASEGCLAKEIENCPYTVRSYQPWLVNNILPHLIKHLESRAFGMVGKAGSGKSPLVEGLACMMSRHWKRKMGLSGKAIFRQACDMDFLRGEVGSVDRPDVLDDFNPKDLSGARWKAMTDVGLVEAMSRERWGAAKWVQNQARFFAINAHDDSMEPPEGATIKHGQFMFLIHPMWGERIDEESKLAVLKRSCLIVVTKDWLYWRPPTQDEVDVERIKLGTAATPFSMKLLHPSAGPLYEGYRANKVEFPEDYEEQLAWEHTWLNAVLSKGALPIPRYERDDGVPQVALVPDLPPIATGSTKRRKFKFPVHEYKPKQANAGEEASSGGGVFLGTVASKRERNDPGSTERAIISSKREKPDSDDEDMRRAVKLSRVEELKRQYEEAMKELNEPSSSSSARPVKNEPIDDETADLLKQMAVVAASETAFEPIIISDSE